MPTRVAIKLSICIITGILATTAISTLLWSISSIYSVMFMISVVLAGFATAFIYYPKLDPTGSTVWKGPCRKRVIALTFDDGPSVCTPDILDVLASKGVKATFFFLGENAKRFPETVKRAHRDGHAIGNHGFSHIKMHNLSQDAIKSELEEAELALKPISTVFGLKIMRAPHGFKSRSLIKTVRSLGYIIIAWTTGVWDSDRPGVDTIITRTLNSAKPGCILLLHDGDGTKTDADRSQTVTALPMIIDQCLKDGYTFATIPRLFSPGGEG